MKKNAMKRNIMSVGHMLFMSVFFTLMSYQINNFPYSNTFVEYFIYICTGIVYLILIFAIYNKINNKKSDKRNTVIGR